MKIAGLQKMTLLDYPGKVACTVFLSGCNYRCPFCHNSGLLENAPEAVTPEGLLEFLKKRRGMLDGVCITGGEPTLQKELPELLEAIKALGYPVKLDTNGSNPAMLEDLLNRGLVDYVAMDVKNCPERYGETVGIPNFSLEKTEQSLRLLLSGHTDYELRTTCVEEFHGEEEVRAMGLWQNAWSPEPSPASGTSSALWIGTRYYNMGSMPPAGKKWEKCKKP